MNSININGREIGGNNPVYIVAEMSANHNGDFQRALNIIGAAKEVGADAIKLQTYTADTMTIDSKEEYFRIDSQYSVWDDTYLYDLYDSASTPWEWHRLLKSTANAIGLDFFSTPFDATAVDFLEQLDVPAYKIASFEIVDIPLLVKVAKTGKPIILSTGMATLGEIDEALRAIRATGNKQIALLKCTSAYPAPMEEMNLLTIPHLSRKTQLPVGLSDHSPGHVAAVAAVALGACIVEKHLKQHLAITPDSFFSLDPHEFRDMVRAIRDTEKAIGGIHYGHTTREHDSNIFRRSLFVVEDIKKGEQFTEDNVRSIRPGNGLHPRYLYNILSKVATMDYKRGTPLNNDLIEVKK